MSEPTEPVQLDDLARRALFTGAALAVGSASRSPEALPLAITSPTAPFEPLLGVRCGPSVVALGYPAEITIHANLTVREATIGVAIARSGELAVVACDGGPPLEPPARGSVTLDLGLRALGLPTPPPVEPVAALVDGVWLDQILELVLATDLGEPPGWWAISRLHPLGGGGVSSPDQLRAACGHLSGGWDSLRRSIARSGRSGAAMSPALAEWLDTGSFARRILASVPDPGTVLADLDELLRPRDAEWLRAALQPSLGTA